METQKLTDNLAYDRSIHSNPDAQAWAKFFMETVGGDLNEIDEDLMRGWFANAMMAMSDHINNTNDLDNLKKRSEFLDCLEELGVDNWDGYGEAKKLHSHRRSVF